MQFTTREMKLVERLRKQERRWPRTRWILLGMVAFILAAYGYIAYLLFHTLGSETFSPADSALLFAIFWPKVILMTGLAGVFIGLAIRDWHGNVHRMLLLRLLDAQQKESGRDEKVG
jgi:hypothetical protein